MKKLLSKILAHKAGIAMGLAVVGVGLVALCATIDERDYAKAKEELSEDADKKDKAICFAKNHWRTGIAILGTEILMIFSHRAMAKELAGATAAIAVAMAKKNEIEDYFKKNYPKEYAEFKKKVNKENIEKIFKEKPEKATHKEETYDGRLRYYEPWSCQVFFATEAQVKEAECIINELIINTGAATLFDYLATFPSSSGVVLEDWMKHFGWYEGDTSYTYNSGYFGPYLKPIISCQDIIFKGDKIEVNTISWENNPDLEPDLPASDIVEIEHALESWQEKVA